MAEKKQNTLRLKDLSEDVDDLELEDGTKIVFLSRFDLDSERLAEIQVLFESVEQAQKKLDASSKTTENGKESDQEDVLEKVRLQLEILEDKIDKLLKWLLPEITDEQVGTIKGIYKKVLIIEWWGAQAKLKKAQAKAGEN